MPLKKEQADLFFQAPPNAMSEDFAAARDRRPA
jgi:hypothetical protein